VKLEVLSGRSHKIFTCPEAEVRLPRTRLRKPCSASSIISENPCTPQLPLVTIAEALLLNKDKRCEVRGFLDTEVNFDWASDNIPDRLTLRQSKTAGWAQLYDVQ
jgi:hypothetical protein